MSAWPISSSAAAVSAVPRVNSVGRADGPELPSRIRDTDPSGAGLPRPDPSRLPPQDVARFEDLVFGPMGRPQALSTADAPHAYSSPATLNVADRIAHTLGHLAVVRGL